MNATSKILQLRRSIDESFFMCEIYGAKEFVWKGNTNLFCENKDLIMRMFLSITLTNCRLRLFFLGEILDDQFLQILSIHISRNTFTSYKRKYKGVITCAFLNKTLHFWQRYYDEAQRYFVKNGWNRGDEWIREYYCHLANNICTWQVWTLGL